MLFVNNFYIQPQGSRFLFLDTNTNTYASKNKNLIETRDA